MAEPTTTTAGWAVAAALTAGFLAALGVSWVHVFFAAGGVYVGAGMTTHNIGRVRAIVAFPFVVLLSAKAGVIAGAYVGAIGAVPVSEVSQALAGAIGLIFQPVAVTIVTAMPDLVRSGLNIVRGWLNRGAAR